MIKFDISLGWGRRKKFLVSLVIIRMMVKNVDNWKVLKYSSNYVPLHTTVGNVHISRPLTFWQHLVFLSRETLSTLLILEFPKSVFMLFCDLFIPSGTAL